MAPFVHEWLNLIVRWAHVIAAIMWIGDSFLFMWLDSHLTAPTRARDGAVTGELWMTHSGGFYEVVKRKSLGKDEMPPMLYWFKWESYSTWITGFLLLIIVYHFDGSALLIDKHVYELERYEALTISLFILPIAYLIYEALWFVIGDRQRVWAVVGLGLITGLAYFLTNVFSARGAFLQVGATLGTIMASNVFFRIIPAQRHMLAATKAGQPVDTSYGLRAKGRSIQNHYLTLPVLFCMLSNHFPSVYGYDKPWLSLAVLVVLGVGVKYVMNKRLDTPKWAVVGTLAALVVVIGMTRPPADHTVEAYRNKPPVKFEDVQAVVQNRCTTCHAAKPAISLFAGPPQGVILDNPDGFREHAERMFQRVVVTKTMPLGNMTGMTQEERDLLGAWYAQGAVVPRDAQPIDLNGPATGSDDDTAAPATNVLKLEGKTPEEKAQRYFKNVCASCHGNDGTGTGVAARALNPKPRNFTDHAWQQAITDERIRDTIVKGGQAMGKSALMPPQPLLARDPETLNAMVKYVRSFGGK